MLETLSLALVLHRFQKLTRTLLTPKTRLVLALDPRRRRPRFHNQFPSEHDHWWSRMRSREGSFVLPFTVRATCQSRPNRFCVTTESLVNLSARRLIFDTYSRRQVRVNTTFASEKVKAFAHVSSRRALPCSWDALLQALTTQDKRHTRPCDMSWLLYRAGFWVRETGQALDRLGCRLQGSNAFTEECKSCMSIAELSQLSDITVTCSHPTPKCHEFGNTAAFPGF